MYLNSSLKTKLANLYESLLNRLLITLFSTFTGEKKKVGLFTSLFLCEKSSELLRLFQIKNQKWDMQI